MTTTKDQLDEIKSLELNLAGGEPDRETGVHRPPLRVWADHDDDNAPAVVLMIGDLWGQPQRFAEMTPEEARRLARMLETMASAVDGVSGSI